MSKEYKAYKKGDMVKIKCVLGNKQEKNFYSWTVGKQGEIFIVFHKSARGKYIVKLYDASGDRYLLFSEEELEPIENCKILP